MWLIVFSLLMGFPVAGIEILYTGSAPSEVFYSDHLDNIYFIDNNKLIKIEVPTGETLEYGSLSAGDITSADVSNPFQILLFYRDFNQILFLDNKLTKLRSEINLSDMSIEQAGLVCSSVKGGIWVFCERSNRLVFFDQQFRNSHQSMILSSITGSNIKPVYMTESNDKLYLNVPGTGIIVFDRFAAYNKIIPYSGPGKFQVMGRKIIYFLDGKLMGLDIEKNEIQNLLLPSHLKIDNAQLQPKRLYLLSGNCIKLFRVNPE